MSESPSAQRILVQGRVQGVGFRPFILRLARRLGLTGWVRNLSGTVEIHVEGAAVPLAEFARALVADAPPLAQPAPPQILPAEPLDLPSFEILDSATDAASRIVIPPDHFVCQDCLAEMSDPAARRFRYPFTNCTQCGPRYTIIDRLPYDRPNTAMAGFPLCAECRAEYEDPADRRYHAQPLACPRCGPTLEFRAEGIAPIHGNEAALAAAVACLRAGRILAVKGVGGYHLMCDARSNAAVNRLRARKHRPSKPLAVLVTEASLTRVADPDPVERDLLLSPLRPIVLVSQAADHGLADAIAPGLNELGLMLPYSPLHHLLCADFDGPLVATSANISGEPVLTEAESVERRLGAVADAFLHHDRPIRRPADDSVFRTLGGRIRPLRLGRGVAPLEMRLAAPVSQPILALGADLKNTVALAVGDRVLISPHLGDLGAPRSLEVFEQVIDDLCRLFEVQPEIFVCDAHPGYFSSHWARARATNPLTVFHHHAHASALHGEFAAAGPLLVFTWDGLGYGADGTLWGGEALLGSPGQWRRIASLRPFRLIGGDRASRAPWRCGLSVCLEAGIEWPEAPAEASLARMAWARAINSPFTSSVGRLFDAAAALSGVAQTQDYEGHAAMRLESLSGKDEGEAHALPLRFEGGLWRGDWSVLLPMLMDERLSQARRSALFHSALADMLLAQARQVAAEYGIRRVGLTGGVFQNRRLLEAVIQRLERTGFEVLIPEQLPVNDASISFGQIVEAQALNTPRINTLSNDDRDSQG